MLFRSKGLAFAEDGRDLAGQSAWLDPVRLRQVLHNLLGNAVKFTAQGEVGASAALQRVDGQRTLRLRVHDSGPGIAPEDRATLFQPYAQGAQGRRAAEGAGLGLAITAQLVSAMGGQLVCLERAHGACFEVTLPLPEPGEGGAPAAGDTAAA